jgi:mono/diheme cytochrome c family protein
MSVSCSAATGDPPGESSESDPLRSRGDINAPVTEAQGPDTEFARPERALSRSDGKALYDRYCVDCHGTGGAGDGPAGGMVEGPAPTNFLDAGFMGEKTPEEFFQAITMGVPGSDMTEWGGVLDSQERWDVIAFLWSLRPDAADLPDSSSCTACHASNGPAVKFTVPGALANRSDRALAQDAAKAGEHESEDKAGLSASVATFERRQIPRMLDLLVEEYDRGVEDGTVVDELEYFEAQNYVHRIAEDIERVVGTGGMDSATVGELMHDLDAAVYEKEPTQRVGELADRLKAAVAYNLSE